MELLENKPKMKKGILFIIVAIFMAITFILGNIAPPVFKDGDYYNAYMMLSYGKKYYYQDFKEGELSSAMAEGITALCLDNYSDIYSKEEYKEITSTRAGNRSGFGFNAYGGASADAVKMYRVVGNSPFDKAGIIKGDILLAVKKGEVSSENEYTALTLGNYTQVFDNFQEGEKVTFKVKSGEEIRQVTTSKEQYLESVVRYYNNSNISVLDGKSAVIKLSSFSGTCVSEMQTAMQRFKEEGKTKLVIDLRDNGGGLNVNLANIASYFIKGKNGEKKAVTRFKYKDGKEEKDISEPIKYNDYNFESIRVVINGNSASATEAFVGALVDYGSMTENDIFGTKSYGKGIMQTTFTGMLKGGAIKLTTAVLYWPLSNRCIHGEGISPSLDNTVYDSYGSPYTLDSDAQLLRAINSL